MTGDSTVTDSVKARKADTQLVYEKIVVDIADREDIAATELQPPLYDAVDPEALNALFEGRDTDGRVEFHWIGYRIVVFSSGSIRIINEEQ